MRSGLRFETFTFAVLSSALVVGCAAGGGGQGGDAGAGGGSVMMMTAGASGGAGSGAAGSSSCTTPPTAHMSWQLSTGDKNGPFVTCAQAGVTTLEVFMNEEHSVFTCTAQSGTTGALTAGSTTPRLLLTSAQGVVLEQLSFPNPITVPGCGVDDIGALVIIVSTNNTGTAGASGTAGAGGSSGSAGATGTGGSTGTGPCNALPIFATHQCSVAGACHDSKGTAANFDMATSGWENTLVGRMPKTGGGSGFNSQCISAGMPYLVAGSSPARGLFLEKLTATPPCGSEMPALGGPLSASELDCVQRWANGLTK